MLKFLRYNGRYSLYFPRGYGGKRWPQLNPISSCSHNGKGQLTWHIYEPGWLFRLRQRLFSYGGRQRCGRRDDLFSMNLQDGHLPDTWDIGPDGNRTCSYCGSLHPQDFLKICRLTLTDERYSIDPSDKDYKVYVRQPGVRNAAEGAIKFYKQHVVSPPVLAEETLYRDAVKVSRERFNKAMRVRG